ncbi:MAG: antibiotic biosynthesis monooxygenase [bacterium]|nr:antibiotic biosynthesis monooxygenase [bacterium]
MTVAVIFVSRRAQSNSREYMQTAERMAELAAQQPGYVDMVTVHDATSGEGMTVSFFVDEAAAVAWKQHPEHLAAQRRGVEAFYDEYRIWVAEVTRDYAFARDEAATR